MEEEKQRFAPRGKEGGRKQAGMPWSSASIQLSPANNVERVCGGEGAKLVKQCSVK